MQWMGYTLIIAIILYHLHSSVLRVIFSSHINMHICCKVEMKDFPNYWNSILPTHHHYRCKTIKINTYQYCICPMGRKM